MKVGKQQRRAIAVWLGIVALGLQALIPLVVAAEIALAADLGRDDAFGLCIYGADASDRSGHGDGQRHDLGLGACPICVALHASPAFTAPEGIGLPLPRAPSLGKIAVAPDTAAARRFAVAAYRSRAPPIG